MSSPSVPNTFLLPSPVSSFSAISSTEKTKGDAGVAIGSSEPSSFSLTSILTVFVMEFPSALVLVNSNSYILSPSASAGEEKTGLLAKNTCVPQSVSLTRNLSASAPPVIVEVTLPANVIAWSSSIV